MVEARKILEEVVVEDKPVSTNKMDWPGVVFRIACFVVAGYLIAHGWVFWPGVIILGAAGVL